jgi:hypothetical protein
MSHPVQGAKLVKHITKKLIKGQIQETPSVALQVAVTQVRTDGDIQFDGGAARVQHGDGISGVQPAGNVGAGQQRDKRGVIPGRPWAKRLP